MIVAPGIGSAVFSVLVMTADLTRVTVAADTRNVPASIKLGGSALSDAADADAGDYNGTRINVALGTVAGGQTRTVTFQTMID